MEKFSKEKTEIRKPPTYLYYLAGVILLFFLGFGVYYFGYDKYLQKQFRQENQNQNLNLSNVSEKLNQNQAAPTQKIYIDSPQENETVGNPIVVKGRALTLGKGGRLNIRIRDANGKILGETATLVEDEARRSDPTNYQTNLSYATSTTEFGLIEAFDYSAKDGGVQNLVSVKIKFANYGQTNNINSECLLQPHVQKYEGLGYNNEASVKEYIVPFFKCNQSLLFVRKDQGEKNNEWDGTFNVYFRENDKDKDTYLFEHKGLLMDIAGGGTWDISDYTKDIIKISLGSSDMGASAYWDYYISIKNKELILGLSGGRGLNVLTKLNNYNFLLNTDPVWCDKESKERTTTAIFINEKKYNLENKIIEDCPKDLTDNFFPPPKIKLVSFDLNKKQIVINIPENENKIFNYETGILND
ncbi:MAG: Gmad2 immunoglobulin-like domain-containing protein [bacterium]